MTTAPNDALARLMQEAGLSRKALARSVRELGDARSDHTSVSRWLAGMTPRTSTVLVILEVLGVRLGRPISADEAGFGDAESLTVGLGLAYASTVDEAVRLAGSLWWADATERRELVTAAADTAAWSAVPLAWLLRSEADPVPARAEGLLVRATDVDGVAVMADAFARMDNDFGGGHGRRALIQYLHAEVAGMLRGRYDEKTGRRLFQVAAEATLLAAWMSYDAGLHGLAQRYFAQALRLAQVADDVLLSASVLDAMSHQATFLGRFQEAANLARAAATGSARRSTPTLRAHFLAMEARALAGAGDATRADRALSAAVTEFDRRRVEDEPEWIRYVDEAELDAEFAHCLRDLGRAAQSVMYAKRSLAAADGASKRSDLFVSVVHAEGLLRQGELDEACSLAAKALEDSERLNSARSEAYVASLMRALTQHESLPAVRDLMVAVRAWQASRKL